MAGTNAEQKQSRDQTEIIFIEGHARMQKSPEKTRFIHVVQ